MLPRGISEVRRRGTAKPLLALCFGAHIIAGAFTLLPARSIGRVMFAG